MKYSDSNNLVKILGIFCILSGYSQIHFATANDISGLRWISDTNIRFLMGTLNLKPLGKDGSFDLFACRAKYKTGNVIPGKYFFSSDKKNHHCHISFNGKEIRVNKDFEVLYTPPGSVEWVRSYGDNIPANAVACGTNPFSQEPTYIGRVRFTGTMTLGKVVRSAALCFVPFGNREWSFWQYEILVAT